MESGSQDRNLPASQRKLRKAREEGNISRSQDLSHAAVLGAGAVGLLLLTPQILEELQKILQYGLSFDAQTIQQAPRMLERLSTASWVGLALCGVFAAVTMLSSILSALASSGWIYSLHPIMPDFSRVSPLSGFGNLFSKKKLIDTAKMTAIAIILLLIGALYLHTGMPEMAATLRQPSAAALTTLVNWLIAGLGLLLLVVIGAALIDVPLQSFLHKESLKMSQQELKQEHKESDGNPQIKSKIRQKQRELAQKSSVTAVPKADFVVMNPTHFAVAVRYDEKTMTAPRVISKGADLLALKIRDVAKQHDIPVLQSPMLARALYANAELDQDIPTALYTAVAQVLAYVYRLRAALRGQGAMPRDVPQPQVPEELDPHSPQFGKTSNQRTNKEAMA
ncbi:EscU/YscU/HrcU family type III secretion system export apparatus switch protein [Curvibacter sp. CHRR-16]|uniref:EscU/YscU/HrcU family type III secretion system export apparatus switch protein n=1 Tax=Curvibacter sp. CHRR-16 TaxID=2835872 RepID=UPI001BDAEA54|nr:EscU/YscU/HrcU family type III secretion system export apparatus switch protein [Curvibacter sp. CHRR-16]MBT0569537.1 EscU/YscU/HrcU family type III secretion system export apparatus switch protein [Curvibacter sp. CHRR-16]